MKVIAVLIAAVVLVPLGMVLYKKYAAPRMNNKLNTLLGVIAFFATGTLIYKSTWMFISSFDFDTRIEFIYVLKKYFSKGYFDISLIALMGMLIIFITVICAVALKKEYIKHVAAQLLAVLTAVYVYSLVVAYIYATQYSSYISSLNGLERYMGSMVIMLLVWLMAFLFAADSYWQKSKAQLICVGLASALIIRCYPVYGETMFNIYDVSTMSFTRSVRPFAQEHADKIAPNTEEDARILFVNQLCDTNYSGSRIQYWITYFMPVRTPVYRAASFTTDKEVAEEQVLTAYATPEGFEALVLKSDYVYVLSTDDEFWEAYGDVFPERFDDDSGRLFKVTPDSDEILEPIPLD
jgi:hypothetical protein